MLLLGDPIGRNYEMMCDVVIQSIMELPFSAKHTELKTKYNSLFLGIKWEVLLRGAQAFRSYLVWSCTW